MPDFSNLFNESKIHPLSIKDLASWRRQKEGRRLLLPPIQRSLVWKNEQIINYWDSLLRGYPPGMMMVHSLLPNNDENNPMGYDADGQECKNVDKNDIMLFDGQQRMATILLALGEGQMKDNRKLWIDLGTNSTNNSGLKFQLRISSTGQPFGYKPNKPNQKIELGKRQQKWEAWRRIHGDEQTPTDVFSQVDSEDLIDAKYAVALKEIMKSLDENGLKGTVEAFNQREGTNPEIVEEFVEALDTSMNSEIILLKVDSTILDSHDEYIRFFERLGQGGTPLSNDELTYSIIKHQYPKIREPIANIINGETGRLASEVDLVLAALRVAKMEDFSDNAIKGEMIGHPKPDFVSQLRDKDKVRIKFLSMIESKTPSDSLEKALKSVRDAVTYDQEKHRKGLPPMLLARLPGDLLDVLLLLAIRRGADQPWSEPDNEILCAFVLHWLLFVCNNEKAALIAFRHNLDIDWKFNIDSIQNLIKKYEDEGIARIIPRSDQLDDLRKQVREAKGQRLRQWAERFTAVDGDGEGNPGEALRVLSTNDNLEKRALMWLQRDFIMTRYPYYDPTSSRDEDLPVDLDHLIPYSNFGFDWRRKEQYLMQDVIKNKNILENFRNERHMIGNSLGNYRWLGARDNRRRGNGCLEELENCGDLVSNVCDWNTLIPNCGDNGKWSRDSISSFQRLIDLRTIDLYEIILTDSDIENILPRR